MLWNDDTESLLGSEFCAFEKYENVFHGSKGKPKRIDN